MINTPNKSMEKWYIFTYIHQKKKINQKIHHPNVGKYTIFPMDHMATSHPTYTSNPPSRSKSPLTWPVVRPAARNGCASARRFGGFVGGHDSVFDPRQQSLGKIGPKNTFLSFFVGRIEEATGSGLVWDMYCLKMMSDI